MEPKFQMSKSKCQMKLKRLNVKIFSPSTRKSKIIHFPLWASDFISTLTFEIGFISISSERHLQLIHPFLAPLLDIESHLLKEMEHGPVFDQHFCIETKEPLFLRQIGKVGE